LRAAHAYGQTTIVLGVSHCDRNLFNGDAESLSFNSGARLTEPAIPPDTSPRSACWRSQRKPSPRKRVSRRRRTADVIAIYSQHVERRLLRAHVDRAAATISLVPFGAAGCRDFRGGAQRCVHFTSATRDQAAGNPATDMFLLDEDGHALCEPLRSRSAPSRDWRSSPKGDRIAASSDRGWLCPARGRRNGQARRLALRTEIGVSADRQFTYAFRPEGGLVTIVDDWVATYRAQRRAPSSAHSI